MGAHAPIATLDGSRAKFSETDLQTFVIDVFPFIQATISAAHPLVGRHAGQVHGVESFCGGRATSLTQSRLPRSRHNTGVQQGRLSGAVTSSTIWYPMSSRFSDALTSPT